MPKLRVRAFSISLDGYGAKRPAAGTFASGAA
jgi:hypothetical protein